MYFLYNLTFLDWVGIIGSLMIAGAYYGVSNNYFSPEKLTYHLINLLGSLLILLSLYFKPNPGAILIELLWIFIASLGIYNYFFRKFENFKNNWFLIKYTLVNENSVSVAESLDALDLKSISLRLFMYLITNSLSKIQVYMSPLGHFWE